MMSAETIESVESPVDALRRVVSGAVGAGTAEGIVAVEAPSVVSSVEVPAVVLFAALSNVLLAAGTDSTLPTLCAVRVEVEGDELTLVATDRYRMHVQVVTLADVSAESWDVLIPSATVKAWTAASGPLKGAHCSVTLSLSNTGPLMYSAPSDEVRLAGSFGSLSSAVVEGDFPRWRALMDADVPADPSVDTVAFNPDFMAAYMKLLGPDGRKATAGRVRNGPGGAPVRVTFRGVDKPVLVTSLGVDGFRGLLMPVRDAG